MNQRYTEIYLEHLGFKKKNMLQFFKQELLSASSRQSIIDINSGERNNEVKNHNIFEKTQQNDFLAANSQQTLTPSDINLPSMKMKRVNHY